MSKRSASLALLAITALGCLLRLSYAVTVPDEFSHGTGFPDTYNYVSIARHLAANFEYANSFQAKSGNPRWGDSGVTSFREPVFPLLLALKFKTIGESPRSTFIMQALIGTLTIPLCFAVATLLFSTGAALGAALLESVNPYHIYYATFVSTENITTVVLLAIILFTLRVVVSIRAHGTAMRKDIVLLILSLSVGILTRAVFISIVGLSLLFVGIACYANSGGMLAALRMSGSIGLVTALCVSPWFIRNYLVWQTFVYHTNVGQLLVMGFNDHASGGADDVAVERFMELDRALAHYPYNEVERDRIYRQEAVAWIRSHPAQSIYLVVKKQLLFWWPVPAIVGGYTRAIGLLWGSVFLCLTLAGIISARGGGFTHKYILGVILTYSVFHSIAVVVTRYRIPLEGVMALFAGYGLAYSFRELQFLLRRFPPQGIARA